MLNIITYVHHIKDSCKTVCTKFRITSINFYTPSFNVIKLILMSVSSKIFQTYAIIQWNGVRTSICLLIKALMVILKSYVYQSISSSYLSESLFNIIA